MHVAEQSLFINLARLLWGFNIELAKDENGQTIPVDFTTASLRPGFMSNPKPYRCGTFPFGGPGELMVAITARSEQHEKVFREEWVEAEREGIQFEYVDYDKLVR